MDMFSILKKNKNDLKDNEISEFIDVEKTIYDMEAEPKQTLEQTDYKNLIYTPPVNDVANYKVDRNKIGIVVDTDQLGYNSGDFHSNLPIYELQKNSSETEKIQFDSIESLQESGKKEFGVIEELDINTYILDDEKKEIEINNFKDIEEKKIVDNEIINNNVEDDFSIFGSKKETSEEIIHEATNYSNEVELTEEVKYTKNGYKICPNCAAILNPDAPVCFMCSKSFIKKR